MLEGYYKRKMASLSGIGAYIDLATMRNTPGSHGHGPTGQPVGRPSIKAALIWLTYKAKATKFV